MSDWHGIMAVDPGGTTGVAYGVFNIEAKWPVAKIVKKGRGKGLLEIPNGLNHVGVAERLWDIWCEQAAQWNMAGVPVPQCHLVVEDFVLIKLGSSNRIGISPVRISAALEMRAHLAGAHWEPIVWQQPGQAKGLVNNDRLRAWDLWVKGSEHKRDALRHLIFLVNRLAP